MKPKIPFEQIPYGFKYGSLEVTRCCSDEKRGWVVLQLATKKSIYQVYATKTGKIRITKVRGK